MRTVTFVEHVRQDLGYAIRMLRRNPGFTVVAVLTLGLGIGANTAIFSTVNAVLLRPLPYRQPDRLVEIHETHPVLHRIHATYPDYWDWRKQSTGFKQMAAYTFEGFDDNHPAAATRTSMHSLRALGVIVDLGARMFWPALGRDQQLAAALEVLRANGAWRTGRKGGCGGNRSAAHA